MDLVEFALGLIEKGGAVAGLGGGYIATRVLGKISDGLKDAKQGLAKADGALTKAQEAVTKAQEAFTKAEEAIKLVTTLRNEVSALGFNIPYRTGGQIGAGEDRTGERIAQLETRMSSIEDDFDEQRKEEKRSWEVIIRAVGRLEGALDRIVRRDPNS